MAKVFVVAEHRDGRLKKATFELLGASHAASNETHAILLGDGVAELAKELAHYGAGAKTVHLCQNPALKFYTAEAYSKIVSDVVKAAGADVLLASHTPTGRDFMPRVAAKLGVGLASDCTQLAFEGATSRFAAPSIGKPPPRSSLSDPVLASPRFAPTPWASPSRIRARPQTSSTSPPISVHSRPRLPKWSRARAVVPT